MTRCRSCGNTINFNVWCEIRKVLEVELDVNDSIVAVAGEGQLENEYMEDISVAGGDLGLSMVNCAWCGSEDIEFNIGDTERHAREQ